MRNHLISASSQHKAATWNHVATGIDRRRLAAPTRAAVDAAHVEAMARTRAVWWYSLGGLWILDALLQAQPIMFAGGVVNIVVLPAAQGQPAWVAVPMQWGMRVWAQHPVWWNAAAVSLELLIGGLVLLGRRHRSLGRAGLWLSIVWSLIVWYFGQGLGGLATGTATYLAGAPGSALLYVLLASLLLLPEAAWASPRLLGTVRAVGAALWAIGALLQLAPLYWSSLGLASVLQSVAMMPLPFGLAALDAPLVASMSRAPVLWNAALTAIMLGLTVLFLLRRGGTQLYILALVWLVFLWIVFQGFGMIFSTMATDPNTPPLWALLLLPNWFAARAGAQPRSLQAAHDS